MSNNIHLGFYRNKHQNTNQQHKNYVDEPEKVAQHFKAKRISLKGNPLKATVDLLTEYKFKASKTSDTNGGIALDINSYPEDQIKQFRITYFDDDNEKKIEDISGNYALDNAEVYEITLS